MMRITFTSHILLHFSSVNTVGIRGLMGPEGRCWKETQERSLVRLLYIPPIQANFFIQARSAPFLFADLTKTPCGAHLSHIPCSDKKRRRLLITTILLIWPYKVHNKHAEIGSSSKDCFSIPRRWSNSANNKKRKYSLTAFRPCSLLRQEMHCRPLTALSGNNTHTFTCMCRYS